MELLYVGLSLLLSWGLWFIEYEHLNVWQLVTCMFAVICRALNRRREGLLGYLEPHPPTRITHITWE